MTDHNHSFQADGVPDPHEGAETGSGWERATAEDSTSEQEPLDGQRCFELCPICRTADLLRGAGPPELRGQIDDVGREALLTLRALVDHYLERLDAQPPANDRVEEIPID